MTKILVICLLMAVQGENLPVDVAKIAPSGVKAAAGDGTCGNGFEQCKILGLSVCLPSSLACNGLPDCDNGTDETNCTTCPGTTLPCMHQPGKCIQRDWLCDGFNDCEDGSDELQESCFTSTNNNSIDNTAYAVSKCKPGLYQCDSGHCVYDTLACDGKHDCKDRSDESDSNCSTACTGLKVCPHECIPTPKGAMCQCRPGFQLEIRNGQLFCDDINECNNPQLCPQLCVNDKGSFHCECAEGFFFARHDEALSYCEKDNAVMWIETIMSVYGHIVSFRWFGVSLTNAKTWIINGSFETEESLWLSLGDQTALVKLYAIKQGSFLQPKGNSHIYHDFSGPPLQLAFEHMTGNVYVGDENTIIICNKTYGSQPQQGFICAHVFNVKQGQITDIKVDSVNQLVFIATIKAYFGPDSHHTNATIWKLSPAGRVLQKFNVEESLESDTYFPITVDPISKKIYYCTTGSPFLLVTLDYNGNRGSTWINTSLVMEPRSLVVDPFSGLIYRISVQDNPAKGSLKVNLVEINPPWNIVRDFGSRGLTYTSDDAAHGVVAPKLYLKNMARFYSELNTTVNNPCLPNPCQHFCTIDRSAEDEISCLCIQGFVLEEDHRGCVLPSIISNTTDVISSTQASNVSLSKYGPTTQNEGHSSSEVSTDTSKVITGIIVSLSLLLMGTIILALYLGKDRIILLWRHLKGGDRFYDARMSYNRDQYGGSIASITIK